MVDGRKNTLIGNLLDHWNLTPNDLKAEMREFGCGKQLDELFKYMEYEQPRPNGGAGVLSAEEVNALPERTRDYIMHMETHAGEGSLVQDNFRLREENAALRKIIAGGAGAEDEFANAARDAILAGTGLMRDGKRIDPADVYVGSAGAEDAAETFRLAHADGEKHGRIMAALERAQGGAEDAGWRLSEYLKGLAEVDTVTLDPFDANVIDDLVRVVLGAGTEDARDAVVARLVQAATALSDAWADHRQRISPYIGDLRAALAAMSDQNKG